MRKMIILIAVVLCLSAWSVNAQEASRRALAEELLNLMQARENIEKSFTMFKQMIPAQMEKMGKAMGQDNVPADVSLQKQKQTEKMWDMLALELNWDKVKDDYINLYAEIFTEEEMNAIIIFYHSPAGVALIKKQPELMKRSMELCQDRIRKIGPKIQAMFKESEKPTPAPALPEKDNQ